MTAFQNSKFTKHACYPILNAIRKCHEVSESSYKGKRIFHKVKLCLFKHWKLTREWQHLYVGCTKPDARMKLGNLATRGFGGGKLSHTQWDDLKTAFDAT